MTDRKVKPLEEVIEELFKEIENYQKWSYKELKEKIQSFRDDLDDKDYCLLLKWLDNNFWDKPRNNWTFWANFVDLIRNWFFFQTKNLMGSFAEEVIDGIAEVEKYKIIKEKKAEDVSEIKQKIWDSFLRDNLLYFKKSNAEDKD